MAHRAESTQIIGSPATRAGSRLYVRIIKSRQCVTHGKPGYLSAVTARETLHTNRAPQAVKALTHSFSHERHRLQVGCMLNGARGVKR